MTIPNSLTYGVAYVLVLSSLMVAGIEDYKSRLINDKYWIPAIIAVPLVIYSVVSNTIIEGEYIIDVMIGIILAASIYVGKFMGEADSIAILLISLATPPPLILNPVLLILNLPIISILINSFIPTMALMLINVYINVKNSSKCSNDLNLTQLILLRCSSVESILRKPLAYSSPGSSLIRAGSDAESYVANLPKDAWVWMQYNYPYVFILAISYVIYIVVGNIIANYVLMHTLISPLISQNII
ncbi:prepilin peptidase [Caldivirga sp.]|uniref:prepilin peptidase n=1 Tax=Caldivirga sp. TaxID=2080243 RepID=UPI003D142C69